MAKVKEIAEKSDIQETTAMTVAGISDIMALSTEGGEELQQIIQENFGGASLTLADLDKIKIPAGGAIRWELPTLTDTDETDAKEIEGIIIAWTDNKAWWQKSYADSNADDKKSPDCRSTDMIYGLGMPNAFFNPKEKELMQLGKARTATVAATIPDTNQQGWLCSSCPHNVFGSAPNGGGKSCQDKRFILVLLKDNLLPVLIRVPATSIPVVKEYFKRLTGSRTSYLGMLTSFTLEKIPAAKPYSKLILKALRKLTPDETAAVRQLRVPFQTALDADDAVDQGYAERDVSRETLDDMPAQAGSSNQDEVY